MDFGDVIKAMRANSSRRFAREGWNGKGMYIYMVPGSLVETSEWTVDDLTGDEAEYGVVKVLPHVDMLSSDGSRVIGWLASQTDMLSDDWFEVTI